MKKRIIRNYSFGEDEIEVELSIAGDGDRRVWWTVKVNGSPARTVSERADIVVHGRHGVVILPFVIKTDEGEDEDFDYSPPGMDDAAIFRKRSVRKRVRGMLKGGSATVSQDGRFAQVRLRDKEGKEVVSCWATPPGCGGDVEINSIPADLTRITTRGSDYPLSPVQPIGEGWRSGHRDACDEKDQTRQRGE